ncbi:hypothetical protein ACS8E2_10045 [Psychrobacter glaciei]|uniref:hypothetical protein n=1 Tax=Psychrobacter glaciei TaxID=619771 RepID=UPI003F454B67
MNDPIAQAIAKPVTDYMFSLDRANIFLVSALVKHLVDEGVIELDKYLESNKKTEETIKKNILSADDVEESDEVDQQRKAEFVGHIFDLHRNDFTKPE